MTVTTPSLFDGIKPPVELDVLTSKLPLAERWPLWRDANGELIEYITRLALSAARRGANRLSMKALFEQVRASAVVDNGGPADFKLNNDYTSLLARLLMDRHAELAGLFETRQRRAA
jgi:hypothetical protein